MMGLSTGGLGAVMDEGMGATVGDAAARLEGASPSPFTWVTADDTTMLCASTAMLWLLVGREGSRRRGDDRMRVDASGCEWMRGV